MQTIEEIEKNLSLSKTCPDCKVVETPTGKRCRKCRASAGGRANAAKRLAEKCGMIPTPGATGLHGELADAARIQTQAIVPPASGLVDASTYDPGKVEIFTIMDASPGQVEEIRRLKEENKGLRDDVETAISLNNEKLEKIRQQEAIGISLMKQVEEQDKKIHLLEVELSAALALAKERAVQPPTQKPPLGVSPKIIANAERIYEILSAMQRYTDASKLIPWVWFEELISLTGSAQAHAEPVVDTTRIRMLAEMILEATV